MRNDNKLRFVCNFRRISTKGLFKPPENTQYLFRTVKRFGKAFQFCSWRIFRACAYRTIVSVALFKTCHATIVTSHGNCAVVTR